MTVPSSWSNKERRSKTDRFLIHLSFATGIVVSFNNGISEHPFSIATPFQHAIAMEANLYLVASAAKPCNESKNRSISYIPMETSRVRLKTVAAADGADYVNASWLPGEGNDG